MLEGSGWCLLGQLQLLGAQPCIGKDSGQPPSLHFLQAQPFTGGLPAQQTLPITGEKQHQILRNVLENLTNVMNGYCLPEPYFSAKVGAGAKIILSSWQPPCPARRAAPGVHTVPGCRQQQPLLPAGEGVGGTADENPAGSLPAPPGAAGNHDQHFRKNPSLCGEVDPEGDGTVCQQHHLRALPLSQPAGEKLGFGFPFQELLPEFILLRPDLKKKVMGKVYIFTFIFIGHCVFSFGGGGNDPESPCAWQCCPQQTGQP